MATADVRNRLQPALLDRLTDDARPLRHEPLRASPAARVAAATPAVGDAVTATERKSEADGAKPAEAPGAAKQPTPRAVEPVDEQRVMSKAQLRQAVLRDLAALFNAVQPLGVEADAYPLLAGTVLNYGLPALSGELASKLDVSLLERAIRQAIVRFEPRILADTLQVRALEATSVLDTHNVIEFEIRGHLWSQPVPLEILLRTQVDLEAGQVEVREAGGTSARAR